jgi:long-subunit acyl-CoA synthetase (AMP-forming)
VLFGWGCRSLRTHVTLGRHGCWGGETLAKVRERGQGGAAFEIADTSGDDEAAILFASGSTGPPKGVMYRHSNFAAQIEAIREFGQIGPGEVDLPISPPLGAL